MRYRCHRREGELHHRDIQLIVVSSVQVFLVTSRGISYRYVSLPGCRGVHAEHHPLKDRRAFVFPSLLFCCLAGFFSICIFSFTVYWSTRQNIYLPIGPYRTESDDAQNNRETSAQQVEKAFGMFLCYPASSSLALLVTSADR